MLCAIKSLVTERHHVGIMFSNCHVLKPKKLAKDPIFSFASPASTIVHLLCTMTRIVGWHAMDLLSDLTMAPSDHCLPRDRITPLPVEVLEVIMLSCYRLRAVTAGCHKLQDAMHFIDAKVGERDWTLERSFGLTTAFPLPSPTSISQQDRQEFRVKIFNPVLSA